MYRLVWLIGGTDEDFKASKFPSKKEVLKVLFHYRIEEKLSLNDSIEKTSSLILPIWDKAIEYQQKLLLMLLMVMALIDRPTEGSDEPTQRISLFVSPETKRLHDFVATSTRRFFQILDLSEKFLKVDPSEWKLQESYLKDQKVATSVKVANDLAE